MGKIYLPKPSSKAAVKEALNYHYDSQTPELERCSVIWEFTHWFLRGFRNIQLRGLLRDMPAQSGPDHKGRKWVKFEQAFVEHIVECGRLLGIDWAPAIERTPGFGLSTLRGESLAQATLNYLWTLNGHEQFKITAATKLSTYGGCGFLVEQPQTAGMNHWEPITSIIPIWELRPLPACPLGVDEVGGLTWARYVPYEWLKERLKGMRLPSPKEKGMDAIDMPYGDRPREAGTPQGESLAFSLGGSSVSRKRLEESGNANLKVKDTTQYVLLKESWLLNTSDWTTHRYILQVGRIEPIADYDYTNDEWQEFYGGSLPTCPMSIPRYTEVASFYPRGFAERQIGINKVVERLYADFIDNARARDEMTGVAIPVTGGFDLKNFKENQKRNVYPYQPHPNSPSARPEIMSPPDSGDGLAGPINMLVASQDKTANQGEVLYGGMPGKRADSARSMGMAVQAGNTGLAMAGESLAFALSCMFRAQLSYVRYLIKHRGQTDLTIRVGKIDETILGVVFNKDNNGIELSQFELPDPRNLRITIRSKAPRTKEMIAVQLKEELRQGTLNAIDYLIMAFREGLDLPLLDRTPYYAAETAAMENVILFGDGETPGDIQSLNANEDTDQHQIHLNRHLELANMTSFKAASDNVQRVILEMIEYHRMVVAGPKGAGSSVAEILRNGGSVNPELLQGMGMPRMNGSATGNPMIA